MRSQVNSNIAENATYNTTNDTVSSSGFCTNLLEEYESLRIFLLFYYMVVMVLAILGNTLIIYIVYSDQSMRTSTNIFIVNMAVCDLGVPFFLIPKRITELFLGRYKWLIPGQAGLALCKLVPFLHDVFIDCSTFSLLLITFDRFCAVIFPHKRHLLSKKALIILISCTWLAAISIDAVFFKIFVTLYRKNGKLYCVPEWYSKSAADAYIKTMIFTNIITPILLITIAYSAIFHKLRKQVQILGNSISDQLRLQESLRQKKIVKMTFAIVCMFGVCWLPVIFTSLLRPFYHLNESSILYSCWVYVFAGVSSRIQILTVVTNPALCFVFGVKYREEFIRIFWVLLSGHRCHRNRRIGNKNESENGNETAQIEKDAREHKEY